MSRIDVSTRGYLGARSGSNGNNEGRTLGNASGSTLRFGGSYGGPGWGIISGAANSVYGDFRNPNELGRGGGSDSGSAGNGGGLVRLKANSLSVNGSIVADGGEGAGDTTAGGSGGGIKIDVTALTGAGTIHANGGEGDDQLDNAGGGGGGRIAILYTTNNAFDFSKLQAVGGRSVGRAAPGTIFLKAAS